MVTESFLRLSAAAGIVGALMLGLPGLIEIGTGETTATSLVIGLAVGPLILLLPGVHLYQSLARPDRRNPRSGSPARLTDGAPRQGGERAYVANMVGLGLFGAAGYTLNLALFFLDERVLDDVLAGPTRPALLACALAFAAGTVAYGVFLIRSRVFPGWVAVGYTVLLPLFAFAAGLPDSPFTGVLHGVCAAVLIAMGARVWSGAPGVTTAAAAPAYALGRSTGGVAP